MRTLIALLVLTASVASLECRAQESQPKPPRPTPEQSGAKIREFMAPVANIMIERKSAGLDLDKKELAKAVTQSLGREPNEGDYKAFIVADQDAERELAAIRESVPANAADRKEKLARAAEDKRREVFVGLQALELRLMHGDGISALDAYESVKLMALRDALQSRFPSELEMQLDDLSGRIGILVLTSFARQHELDLEQQQKQEAELRNAANKPIDPASAPVAPAVVAPVVGQSAAK